MAQKIVDNWLSLAEYDLTTADARTLAAMETLNSYYIESRYTEDIQELASTMTETKAKEVLQVTREAFAWIKWKL